MLKLRPQVLPSFLLTNLFLLCILFQFYLITQLPLFYPILRILFFLEILGLAAALVLASPQNKILFLAFLLIITIRIPFYLQGNGLIFHSDNALEALQPLEIQDSHKSPFFLLNSSGHNGTLKYLFVAFIWDLFGKSYVTFVLFQLVIFLLFIFLFYRIFQRYADEKIVRLFLFVHFAFIEVIFDYSLFLRAAPYLEMLTFFLLGIYLFDFSFRNRKSLFLSYYFLLFSSYLHPLIVFLIASFVLTTIILSLPRKKLWLNLASLLCGGVAAAFHLVYYQFFWPPPPPSGAWYEIIFFSPSQFSLTRIPLYLKNMGRDLWISFQNLFSFEFLYSLEFFRASSLLTYILKILNRIAIFFSLTASFAALGMSIRRLLKSLLLRGRELPEDLWPHLFLTLSFGVLAARAFLLSPKPFYEPRHNIDLALWIAIGLVIVFSSLKPISQYKILRMTTIFFLFLLTAPHYTYYLKVASFKKESYRQLMPILRANGVRYLATDFSLAYPIYFLSDRQIKVTDSMGPVTVPFFYYWLRKEVDQVPWENKAYLFFGDRYYRRSWHIIRTREIRNKLLARLENKKIRYQVYDLPYYLIIIPQPAKISPPRSVPSTKQEF